MAPRFRRRKGGDDGDDPEDTVRLDEEHAWWAQRPVEEVWRPREDEPAAEAPERDILAEHFGTDWRTSFGFDAPPGAAAGPDVAEPLATEELPAEEPFDPADPYSVLGIDADASWEDIVDAHRRMARRHHPDRLVGRPPAEVAAGEDRIRGINAAYAELKIRRGR